MEWVVSANMVQNIEVKKNNYSAVKQTHKKYENTLACISYDENEKDEPPPMGSRILALSLMLGTPLGLSLGLSLTLGPGLGLTMLLMLGLRLGLAPEWGVMSNAQGK